MENLEEKDKQPATPEAGVSEGAAVEQQPVDLKGYIDDVMPGNGLATDEERIAALIERDRKNEDANKKLLAYFEENPEFGHMVSQVTMRKRAPQTVFAELFGDGEEYQKYIDEAMGADDEDGVRAMFEARKSKKAEASRLEAEMAQRQEDFVKTIEAWVKKRGLTEDQEKEFKDVLEAFLTALADLKLTDRELDYLYKLVTYDADVEAAEVRGKNDQIATIIDREQGSGGDGTPGLSSRSAPERDDKRAAILDKWT